jgi:hypothetical protein
MSIQGTGGNCTAGGLTSVPLTAEKKKTTSKAFGRHGREEKCMQGIGGEI